MKNLYDELGVNKKASKDEIKKAYRKKSKKVHPDKGGKASEFRDLAVAYQVLGNDEKRGRYDSGESWESILKTSSETSVLAALADVFFTCINSCDTSKTDVLDFMKKNIKHGQKTLAVNKNQLEQQIEKYEGIKKRMSIKDGENYFVKMLEAKVGDFKTSLRAVEEQNKLGERMLEMLKDYKYEVDKKTETRKGRMTIGGVEYEADIFVDRGR